MPLFTLSSLTCHRFIIASIAVSSKGLCDVFCTNHLYAKVGGIGVNELNVLEREFLKAIDWRIMCPYELLQEYYTNLVRTHSTSHFFIVGQNSSGSSAGTSSDSASDIDMDSSGASRPPSPSPGPSTVTPSVPARVRDGHRRTHSTSTTSTIVVDPADLESMAGRRPGPTLEQNMAFAALQESLKKEESNKGEG